MRRTVTVAPSREGVAASSRHRRIVQYDDDDDDGDDDIVASFKLLITRKWLMCLAGVALLAIRGGGMREGVREGVGSGMGCDGGRGARSGGVAGDCRRRLEAFWSLVLDFVYFHRCLSVVAQ